LVPAKGRAVATNRLSLPDSLSSTFLPPDTKTSSRVKFMALHGDFSSGGMAKEEAVWPLSNNIPDFKTARKDLIGLVKKSSAVVIGSL